MHVKYNQDKCTNGCIMLATVLLTNNILDKCSENNKFVCQNPMQSMPTSTSPEKIHCHTDGLTGSAFTSLCTDFNTPAITLYLQILCIAITGVLSEMLRNAVSRGANVPPLMCNWLEG
jgi:hypothetical protein